MFNKKGYGYFNPINVVVAFITPFLFVAIFMGVMIYQGTITIAFPQTLELAAARNELTQCNTNLGNAIAAKTPSCASCECTGESDDNISLFITGAIFSIVGVFIYLYFLNKVDKLKEEKTKLEQDIKKIKVKK